MCSSMKITVIFLETKMLMTKREYASWRDVQDEFEDYTASLNPDSPEFIIEYLAFEYPNLNPSAAEQVNLFLLSENEFVELAFRNEQ